MEIKEREEYRELVQELDRVQAWMQRTTAENLPPVPTPGSPLERDDDKLGAYATHPVAWTAMMHAVDHLHMLRQYLRTAGTLHMFAPYSLVRGGIENSCVVIWLLAPSDQRERLIRRLRLAASDITNSEEMKALVGNLGPRTRSQRLDDLKTIAQREGLSVNRVERGVGPSVIVKGADEDSVLGGQFYLKSWKACSGIAHADQWTLVTLAQAIPMLDGSPRFRNLHTSIDVTLLRFVAQQALRAADRAWQLLSLRGMPGL